MPASALRRIDDTLYEIPSEARADMRVPARVFADDEILEAIVADRSLEQLQNVATLPGIVDAAIAMPDIHQGYGFPVGGLAATELPDGVVSPGGVGYDINCGVRLLALPLTEPELSGRREPLVHELARAIPAGAGKEAGLRVDLERVLREGSGVVAEREDDVERTESEGSLPGADPAAVSTRARERGRFQLGTMGSGNHFVEVQLVEAVFDEEAAAVFGLAGQQVTVLIHSGSRGLGHQVCTDYVKRMDAALPRFGIRLPDRQLSCAPASSAEGAAYLGAMACAANFAWANRQAIANQVRSAVARVLGAEAADGTRQVYDVTHNVAKVERHRERDVLVHRKGATRSFPAGSDDIPPAYREVGQPVFIPGSMGTASYVLAGEAGAMERSFATTCHGAGRRLSRSGAKKQVRGADLRRELEARGIVVRSPSTAGLAEEAPLAYKDVDAVVEIVERAGLARRVARLVPLGVVKG
jgi:tRNA-splicing ligase RtcB (3'-phosphate/5'-hydroxy nucleic acid ligase)